MNCYAPPTKPFRSSQVANPCCHKQGAQRILTLARLANTDWGYDNRGNLKRYIFYFAETMNIMQTLKFRGVKNKVHSRNLKPI